MPFLWLVVRCTRAKKEEYPGASEFAAKREITKKTSLGTPNYPCPAPKSLCPSPNYPPNLSTLSQFPLPSLQLSSKTPLCLGTVHAVATFGLPVRHVGKRLGGGPNRGKPPAGMKNGCNLALKGDRKINTIHQFSQILTTSSDLLTSITPGYPFSRLSHAPG